MGFWIVIATVLFVLGSIMALKPSGIDVRLDKLRMTARKLGLNPKLVACPDWVRGKNDEFGVGMMGQYALILENTKLPETHYQVINGELRVDLHDKTSTVPQQARGSLQQKTSHQQNLDKIENDSAYLLDKVPLELPETIQPFVKGIYSKANNLVVFWEDSSYVKPLTNPNYSANMIEPDLLALKSRMLDWANMLDQTAGQ